MADNLSIDRRTSALLVDPAPCRRRGLQTAGRRRLLLGQRRGSASGAIGEGLSAAGHHHDGGGTRAGHRGWAIDAVTAPYPSHRQALSLSSTERSRACRFREYDIFRSGTGLAVSVPSFVSTILLARSLKVDYINDTVWFCSTSGRNEVCKASLDRGLRAAAADPAVARPGYLQRRCQS